MSLPLRRAATLGRRWIARPSIVASGSSSLNTCKRQLAVLSNVKSTTTAMPHVNSTTSVKSRHIHQAPVAPSLPPQNSPLVQPYKTHPPASAGEPTVHSFFDETTATWTYVVVALDGKTCLVIDPVLDFHPETNSVTTKSADKLLRFISQRGYLVSRILETHAHADHLTSAQYLKTKLVQLGLSFDGLNVPVCIGEGITQVQNRFASRYGFSTLDISNVFDVLFRQNSNNRDSDSFDFGGSECQVLYLPGHTPDHVGYKIGNNVFSGDVIFQPDVGSARADFPGGSPISLFDSVQQILSLPDTTRLYIGHDYPPSTETTRPPSCFSTVELEREHNIHLHKQDVQSNFIKLRVERDAKLGQPRLLHQSLQVNIRAGKLPPCENDGKRWFRIPIEVESEVDF